MQVETRQRQLDSLRRLEERYRSMSAGQAATAAAAAGPNRPPPQQPQGAAARPNVIPEKQKHPLPEAAAAAGLPDDLAAGPSVKGPCACHRLAMYVLDIGRAVGDEPEVEWLPFKSNASLAAPEETILYTLVSGRSELIMFGGIQKDVSTIASGRNSSSENDTVFNDVYFLTPPIQIV